MTSIPLSLVLLYFSPVFIINASNEITLVPRSRGHPRQRDHPCHVATYICYSKEVRHSNIPHTGGRTTYINNRVTSFNINRELNVGGGGGRDILYL